MKNGPTGDGRDVKFPSVLECVFSSWYPGTTKKKEKKEKKKKGMRGERVENERGREEEIEERRKR